MPEFKFTDSQQQMLRDVLKLNSRTDISASVIAKVNEFLKKGLPATPSSVSSFYKMIGIGEVVFPKEVRNKIDKFVKEEIIKKTNSFTGNYASFLTSPNRSYSRSEAQKMISIIDKGTKNGDRKGVPELIALGKIVRDYERKIQWDKPVTMSYTNMTKKWHRKVKNATRAGSLSDVINEFKRSVNDRDTNRYTNQEKTINVVNQLSILLTRDIQ